MLPGAGAQKGPGEWFLFTSVKVLALGPKNVTNQAGIIGHEVIWGRGFLPWDHGSLEGPRMDLGAPRPWGPYVILVELLFPWGLWPSDSHGGM